jgi:hypothetical protein
MRSRPWLTRMVTRPRRHARCLTDWQCRTAVECEKGWYDEAVRNQPRAGVARPWGRAPVAVANGAGVYGRIRLPIMAREAWPQFRCDQMRRLAEVERCHSRRQRDRSWGGDGRYLERHPCRGSDSPDLPRPGPDQRSIRCASCLLLRSVTSRRGSGRPPWHVLPHHCDRLSGLVSNPIRRPAGGADRGRQW